MPLVDISHPDAQYADRLARLTLMIVGQWLERSLPLAGAYPDMASVCLAKGNVSEAVVHTALHWHYMVETERLAVINGMVAWLYRDIIWLKWPAFRLILFLAASDFQAQKFVRTPKLARPMAARLPDKRLPEDGHQQVRDFQ